MSTTQLMEMADALATELLEMAERRKMTKYEFLMMVAITERLLQKVVLFDDVPKVLEVLEEADATLKAVSEVLETH